MTNQFCNCEAQPAKFAAKRWVLTVGDAPRRPLCVAEAANVLIEKRHTLQSRTSSAVADPHRDRTQCHQNHTLQNRTSACCPFRIFPEQTQQCSVCTAKGIFKGGCGAAHSQEMSLVLCRRPAVAEHIHTRSKGAKNCNMLASEAPPTPKVR